MELKFTFEDGSTAYLQHYGVTGMTWDESKKKKHGDEKKKSNGKRNASTVRAINKAVVQAASGSSARKAKAKVKAHFARNKKVGRKHLSVTGLVEEDLGNGRTKKTYY